jgi:hypothetical protein
MENKKLLSYLLKDLSELDELFAESGKNSFDNFEMEFIQNRISGSIRLIKLFIERENNIPAQINPEIFTDQNQKLPNLEPLFNRVEEKITENIKENPAIKTPGVWVEEKATKVFEQEVSRQIEPEIKAAEKIIEKEEVSIVENNITAPEIVQETIEIEQQEVETQQQNIQFKSEAIQKELELEDDEPVDIHNKRLGDSFLKEKSVNDIRSDDMSKLEHKLSNRPLSSIQSAIGINDRFQYIRELFEGSADNFVKAVADLDSMNDMKEAVDYLQTNFKWKKNEASLKFVNLIKRRFPNE